MTVTEWVRNEETAPRAGRPADRKPETLMEVRKMIRNGFYPFLAGILALMLAACSEPPDNNRAVFLLIDISSDYATEMDKAERLGNYLLGTLDGGDSLAVAFIDNSSFTERNIIARQTFERQPSTRNAQKRAFQAELGAFMERFSVPSYHSDITGGVLLARDYLEETGAAEKHLFLLSDLHEDVPPGVDRNVALGLDGVRVHAINVKRQRVDNRNPRGYRERMVDWQRRVEDAGGEWQIVNDVARLDTALALR